MEPLEHLVGGVVSDYFKANRIGQKVSLVSFQSDVFTLLWIFYCGGCFVLFCFVL